MLFHVRATLGQLCLKGSSSISGITEKVSVSVLYMTWVPGKSSCGCSEKGEMVACLAKDTKGGFYFFFFCNKTLESPTTMVKVSSSGVMGATAFECIWISKKNNASVVFLLLILFFLAEGWIQQFLIPWQTMCYYPSWQNRCTCNYSWGKTREQFY